MGGLGGELTGIILNRLGVKEGRKSSHCLAPGFVLCHALNVGREVHPRCMGGV